MSIRQMSVSTFIFLSSVVTLQGCSDAGRLAISCLTNGVDEITNISTIPLGVCVNEVADNFQTNTTMGFVNTLLENSKSIAHKSFDSLEHSFELARTYPKMTLTVWTITLFVVGAVYYECKKYKTNEMSKLLSTLLKERNQDIRHLFLELSSSVNEDFGRLKDDVSKFRTSANHNMDELRTDVSNLNKSVNHNMAELKDDVANLRNTVNHNMDELRTDVSNLNKSVNHNMDELKDNVANLKNTVNKGLDELKDDVASFNKSVNQNLDEVKDAITNLSNNLHELNNIAQSTFEKQESAFSQATDVLKDLGEIVQVKTKRFEKKRERRKAMLKNLLLFEECLTKAMDSLPITENPIQ